MAGWLHSLLFSSSDDNKYNQSAMEGKKEQQGTQRSVTVVFIMTARTHVKLLMVVSTLSYIQYTLVVSSYWDTFTLALLQGS